MSGLKVAAGDSILHLGFFIVTLYLPKNVRCDQVDYGDTISLLCLSHAINCTRFIVKFISETVSGVKPEWRFGTTFVERLWRIFGVFF
jgi:ribosome biogenesis protein Tsr3